MFPGSSSNEHLLTLRLELARREREGSNTRVIRDEITDLISLIEQVRHIATEDAYQPVWN